MKLIISNINKVSDDCQSIRDYVDKLRVDDRIKYNNISHPLKKRQFLIGRMLVYEYYGYDFTINENGKLCTKGVYVSLAHSDNWVILGLSDTQIGVDIENFLKQRQFVDMERFLGFLPCHNNPISFYRQFTAFEADYKLDAGKSDSFHTYYKIKTHLICVSCKQENMSIEIYQAIPFKSSHPIALIPLETN